MVLLVGLEVVCALFSFAIIVKEKRAGCFTLCSCRPVAISVLCFFLVVLLVGA